MVSALWLFLAIHFISALCSAVDRIPKTLQLRDGETITSAGKKFSLGFFSPNGTTNRYVGIWYSTISPQSVVWVANRKNPIPDRNGTFGISGDGNFAVLDGRNVSVWRTNVSVTSENATMVLKDDGDLVLCTNPEKINGVLWRSFTDPTDTFLPEMRANVSDGERKILSSWTSPGDPSPGRFSMGIDPRASPQIVVWDGDKRRWRSGHWNRVNFLGLPNLRAISKYGFNVYGDNGGYIEYTPSNSSDFMRFTIDWEGNEVQQRWDESIKQWKQIQSQPADDPCGFYNRCGKFAKCATSSAPVKFSCSCVDGFVPNNGPEGGCIRRTKLQCGRNSSEGDGGKDGFREVVRIKLPDFADAESDAVNEEDCRKKCEGDCSCNAFAFVYGIPCMIWRTDLVDMQQFEKGSGSTLFLRLARSELGDKKKRRTIIVATSVAAAASTIILVTLAIWILYKRKSKRKKDEALQSELPSSGESSTDLSDGTCPLAVEGNHGTGSDLASFTFTAMAIATNHFSHENKLGQGGFGHVYKGVLPCGQEVAVKRLSRKSNQGMQEFKNELTVIARLQHRNLVRLLGCCVEGEEKMLLYEYMPNKSLDSFIFDSVKRGELNWRKRYQIIEEIARGLLYLHRDSRLRIIHRDLKASNILLDSEMNPKISDFGMARIFGGNQNEENTNRVVGTYGYMAPEYAMEGLFSVKSDVYSFGVLLLEIVSGRRNNSFRSSYHSGIVEYAWEQWDQGKPMNLMDPLIFKSCVPPQVLRCIQIGLLCVQDLAVHRPNMSSIVLFLETDDVTLPAPRPPTYTASMRRLDGVDSWNQDDDLLSSNSLTLSVIVGR
ncbi:unnamed protein product [Cuscuta epithymum]|uniref:Receptor-like serine/threonine-protein kinase n=1 Tax=Cuscuta epithymum TaxID=186058 RepID=A0AAV0F5X6_9ASTE|nr:unnamed protein product [Cuscuta epithymum]